MTAVKNGRLLALAGLLATGALAMGAPAASAHHVSGSKSVGLTIGPTPIIPIEICVDGECETHPFSAPALGGTLDVTWLGHSNAQPTATEIACPFGAGKAMLVETYGGTIGFDVGFTPAASSTRQGIGRFETFGPRRVQVLACAE